MVMPVHVCPYGLKSKYLLERAGYTVDDHYLRSREETEAFKLRHEVETTPQTWIGDERVGGYDALRENFGKRAGPDSTSYRPVIALFVVAFLIALAMRLVAYEALVSLRTVELFVATSMTLLALQKLQDVESFSTMFLNYDLLARRFVPYSYIYPYAEGLAGVLMIAGVLIGVAAPVALFIGTVGAISVFKAVYIDRRELKCACVGGNSNVPLGFVALTENLLMVGMGIWMPLRLWVF
jgi:glutaredoxin